MIFESHWEDARAAALDQLDLLVYRSNLLGQDPRIVNRGGGNTSTKRLARDFRGREVRVLSVKGSGADLRAATRSDFPDVRLDDVVATRGREQMSDEDMVDYLAHALLEPSAPRPSIETLLHGFLPWPEVDHVHADAILAFCMAERGEEIARQVFGLEVVWVPYIRPGFAMAKQCAEAVESQPNCRAVFLGKHGLVTWAESAKQSYLNTLEFINRAAEYIEERARGKRVFGGTGSPALPEEQRGEVVRQLLPVLRGRLSRERRVILQYTATPDVLEFVNAPDSGAAAARGLACPDHVLYTKVKPLFVPPAASAERRVLSAGDVRAQAPLLGTDVQHIEQSLDNALATYEAEYRRFFEEQSGVSWDEASAEATWPTTLGARRSEGAQRSFEPLPKVILIPQLGMVTAGKDQRAARIAAENYRHAIQIMRGATVLDHFLSLTDREAFDFEYWPLELYKLTLLPPEKELARRVGFITGAAGAIGRAIARRFSEEGAHLMLADINLEGARQLAADLPGPALAVQCDVTDAESVAAALAETVMGFGGLDVVVSNAGVAVAKPVDELSLEEWRHTVDVLLNGYFLVTREALKILKRQVVSGERTLGGSIIFVASKAGLAPAKSAAAYASAKAAELHLARCVAEEAGPFGIRVNTLAPDAIFEGSGIWQGQWGQARTASYGVNLEALQELYRQRSTLKQTVTAADVAEAALFFASERSAKTTGGVLTVDAGLAGGYVR